MESLFSPLLSKFVLNQVFGYYIPFQEKIGRNSSSFPSSFSLRTELKEYERKLPFPSLLQLF